MFIPSLPYINKIIIDSQNVQTYFNCLKNGNLTQQFIAKAYDQYGDLIDGIIIFTLNNTPTGIALNNGLITIGQVEIDCNLILTATCGIVMDTLPIYIKKYMPAQLEILQATVDQLVIDALGV